MGYSNIELEQRIKNLEQKLLYNKNDEPVIGRFLGQIWYDNSEKQLKVFNGKDFVPVGGNKDYCYITSLSTTIPIGNPSIVDLSLGGVSGGNNSGIISVANNEIIFNNDCFITIGLSGHFEYGGNGDKRKINLYKNGVIIAWDSRKTRISWTYITITYPIKINSGDKIKYTIEADADDKSLTFKQQSDIFILINK